MDILCYLSWKRCCRWLAKHYATVNNSRSSESDAIQSAEILFENVTKCTTSIQLLMETAEINNFCSRKIEQKHMYRKYQGIQLGGCVSLNSGGKKLPIKRKNEIKTRTRK